MKALSFGKRFVSVLVLLSIVTWLAYRQLDQPPLGIDDAHIFFVYGKHIASGYGVVYTPGGERVEGFSSPLWVLIVSFGFSISADPRLLLLIISIGLVSGALAALWQFVDASDAFTVRGGLLLAWVLSSPGFVVWTTLTLMDTALWTTLIIVGSIVALHLKRPVQLAVVIALTLLTRSEGTLWAAGFIAVATLVQVSQQDWRKSWHHMRAPVVVYGLVLGLVTLARVMYFGYPFPNTYYAKVSSDYWYNLQQGSLYLGRFLAANFLVLLVLVGIVQLLILEGRWLLKQLPRAERPLDLKRVQTVGWALLCLLGLGIPLLTGGDHFVAFRFYQPIWALLLVPLLLHQGTNIRHWSRRQQLLAVCAASLGFTLVAQARWLRYDDRAAMRYEFQLAEVGRQIGTTLSSLFNPPLPSIGVITAGGIAFTYAGEIIDVMGLNNLTVAHAAGERYGIKNHAAFNIDIFLQQRPRLFMPLSADRDIVRYWQDTYQFNNMVLKGMLADPRFTQVYTLVLLPTPDRPIIVYIANSYLQQLQTHQFPVQVLDATRLAKEAVR